MSNPKDLALELKEALNEIYVPKGIRISGLLGDGTTEQRVEVDGAGDRVYFRPEPYENAVWQPIHRRADVPRWHGYPVLVEFNEAEQDWIVVASDWNKLAQEEDKTLAYLAGHNTQHIINEDAVGDDPVWLYRRGQVMLRGEVPADGTFRLYVTDGDLPYSDPDHFFAGPGPFLSASTPGSPNQRWVTHYISLEGYVEIVEGDAHLAADAEDNPPPVPPDGTVPIAYVLVQHDSTAITESMIFDARRTIGIIGQGTGGDVLSGTDAERIALDPSLLDEGTQFYVTDKDKIWQVWNSLWRLAIEPSGLSTSDGDAGTPWATDASGNLIADDGTGDSPQLQLVGGSNNDTADIFLDDSGVANESDLAFNLPGTTTASVFNIRDQTGSDKMHINAQGATLQFVRDAVTNTFSLWSTMEHSSTGLGATGLAGRMLYRLENAGNAMVDAGAIQIEWEDATAASEDTVIRFYGRKGGAVLSEFVHFGSTEAVFNEGSADIDFRVESNALTHMLFVNAGNDRFGVGTSSPSAPFHAANLTGNTTAHFETQANVNTLDFSFFHTGAPAAANIQYTYSTRSNNLDFWLFGYDGTTFKNIFKVFWTAHEFNVAALLLSADNDASIGIRATPTANGGKVLSFGDNAADPTMAVNTAGFYGKDVGGTVEAFAIDEAGNAAQLTPHNFDGPVQPLPNTLHWSQYHQNAFLGVKKWYDLERALLALETLTGQQFIFTEEIDKLDWYINQARQGTKKPMPDWMKGV